MAEGSIATGILPTPNTPFSSLPVGSRHVVTRKINGLDPKKKNFQTRSFVNALSIERTKRKSSLLSWNFIGKSGPNRPIEWEQHIVAIYSRAIHKEDKTVDGAI